MNNSLKGIYVRISFITAIILMTGNCVVAQEKGIRFEHNLTWQQLLAKAKAERKYIFVDCYATWCVPCRKMDQKVYTDSLLGGYVNKVFISVKVQMDSTKNDNEYVNLWRNDARQLEKAGKVGVYPSFLFFDPNGQLVYKEVGYHSVLDFLKITMNASDPEKQIYSLLEKYREGSLYDATILSLINKMENADDRQAAEEVAIPYIHNYLIKKTGDKLFTPTNINLMSRFLSISEDPVFDLFRQSEGKIDTIMNARAFVFNKIFEIVNKEYFAPKLWFGKQPITKKPNWGELAKPIAIKYGQELAARVMIYEKVSFYTGTEQWKELVESEIWQVEKYKQDFAPAQINDMVFSHFFLHSDDKNALQTAAGWFKTIVDRYPNKVEWLDTYANLQYKLGNKQEAIALEQKAHKLARREDDRKDTGDALAKMQANKPTWPTK